MKLSAKMNKRRDLWDYFLPFPDLLGGLVWNLSVLEGHGKFEPRNWSDTWGEIWRSSSKWTLGKFPSWKCSVSSEINKRASNKPTVPASYPSSRLSASLPWGWDTLSDFPCTQTIFERMGEQKYIQPVLQSENQQKQLLSRCHSDVTRFPSWSHCLAFVAITTPWSFSILLTQYKCLQVCHPCEVYLWNIHLKISLLCTILPGQSTWVYRNVIFEEKNIFNSSCAVWRKK